MLCAITHITEDVLNNLNVNHRNQVNTVMKTLFDDLSEKLLHETIHTFWIEFTDLNNKVDRFDSKKFTWISKDVCGGNSYIWHQKYSLTLTKVLGFVACRVTSKILGYNMQSVHKVMLKQSSQA